MRITAEKSIALLIDIQEKLFPHMQEGEALLDNCRKLVRGLSALNVPFLLSEQYPRGLGLTIETLRTLLPEYIPLEKISFSCCGSDVFNSSLARSKKHYVLIAGIEAHVCVMQTVIDLCAAKYQPVVIEDCISSRRFNDKIISLERMRREGAIISTCESILFELCQQAGTETFKAISKIVK
jgi:hypothetical protein